MLVGVISDTHGLLRPEACTCLRGVDRILHAGDIGRKEVVNSLRGMAPVAAIRGNVDTGAWAKGYPEELHLEIAGFRIFMLHDRKALAFDPAARGVDIVISGHSHKPVVERHGAVLFLNPGSAGSRRFRLPVTLAHLDLGGPIPEARIIDLLPPATGQEAR